MTNVTQPRPHVQAAPLRRWSVWRYTTQVTILVLTLLASLRYALGRGASVEAYCPFGVVETTWSALTQGTLLRNLGFGNGIVLFLVLLLTILLGRAFCGWACPIGTIQDGLAGLSRRLFQRQGPLPWAVPRWLDRPLRWLKGLVLGWVLWASVTAVVPPLAPYCPFRTLFEFDWNSLLSLGIVSTFGLLSLTIERFWCRYLCPLGAILATLNWISPLRPRVAAERCVTCGRCAQRCPAGIDPTREGLGHPECVRCYACVEACRLPGAMQVGVSEPLA